LKWVNDAIKAKIAKRYPQVPNLNIEVNILAFKYKQSKVEKFNDPGWDYKYTVEAGGSLKLSGRIPHPQFSFIWHFPDILPNWHDSIGGFSIGSELYVEPYFELTMSGAAVKDPSKEYAGWTMLSNPIKISATGGIRGVFNVVATGAGYSVEGGFLVAAELTADLLFYLTTGELKVKFTLTPLQGNTKVLIEKFIEPKQKWTVFDYTVDLIDKIVSPEFEIYDFGEDQ
jgi:hypothetical protein